MATKRTILATTLALILSACGGGGDSRSSGTGGTGGGGGTPDPVTPVQGVFIDSAVSGIHYETATQSGETDAQGRFSYLPGETVTFSLGGITLPAVEASAKITPAMVFATSDFTDQRVLNLGRLLQSLDSDGDLDNGIQISDAARSAAAGVTIDLNVGFEEFESNAQVVNLVAASGGSATLVPLQDAFVHLQEQATMNGLSLVGTWYFQKEGTLAAVTFLFDGTFILVEDDQDAPRGGPEKPGVEYGTYTWDPADSKLTVTVSVDTNGQGGLSHSEGELRIALDGDSAVFSEAGDADGPTTLQRLVADPDNALVGGWFGLGTPEEFVLVLFLPDNQYLLADLYAADENGVRGMERGSYSWNKDTHAFSVGDVVRDTNGDRGLANYAPPSLVIEDNLLFTDYGGGLVYIAGRLP